jgi:HSP20 family protein
MEADVRVRWRSTWTPAADVHRDRQGWVVKLDLAGVRTEDIELSVAGRRLMIWGVRRDWPVGEGQQTYLMEIPYHRFERSIELPCDVATARIATEYRDGMLLVRLEMETEP